MLFFCVRFQRPACYCIAAVCLLVFTKPKLLSKILRKQVFSDVLSHYEVDIESFLLRTVTLVMKRDPSLSIADKKTVIGLASNFCPEEEGKVVVSVSWDTEGMILVDMPRGGTINSRLNIHTL